MKHWNRIIVSLTLAALAVGCQETKNVPPPGASASPSDEMVGLEGSGRQLFARLRDSSKVSVIPLYELEANNRRFPPPPDETPAALRTAGGVSRLALPASVNLSRFQTPIRNQNPRGTCIVFSNIAALEAAYKRQFGLDLDLSEEYMNTIRQTVSLSAGAVPLPRAENFPGSWGGGGSWDNQIQYMRFAGVPLETDAPYLASTDYENTTQDGDDLRTDPDWMNYHTGRVTTQENVDRFNLTDRATEFRVPGPLTRTALPIAALEHAVYRATRYVRAPLEGDRARSLDWFKTQLAASREVVFDFSGGWDDRNPTNGIWDPPKTASFGHSMLMIGYDDASRSFLVKNSWGGSDYVRFSYDNVTEGFVYGAHAILEIAAPSAPTNAQLFLGRWNARLGLRRGTLDLYHFPGLNRPEQLAGLTDHRVGTFFEFGGNAYRVNGELSHRELSLYVDFSNPDLPYDRLDGSRFDAALQAGNVVLRGPSALPEAARMVAWKRNAVPTLELRVPARADLNRSFSAVAIASDPEDGLSCCAIRWAPAPTSGGGRSASYLFAALGRQRIEATTTDSMDSGVTAFTDVEVVNTAPTAFIASPTSGTTVFRGQSVSVSGYGLDRNEGPGPEDGRLETGCRWSSTNAGDTLPSSCSGSVSFTASGSRTLSLIVTDPQGAVSALASVAVSMADAPANLPPNASIAVSPAKAYYVFDQNGLADTLRLNASASDPEGNLPLSHRWQARKLSATGSEQGTPLALGNDAAPSWTLSGPATQTFLLGDASNACSSGSGQRVRIELTVTDSLGNALAPFTASSEIRIVCPPS